MAGTDRTQHDGGVTLLTIGWGVALLASDGSLMTVQRGGWKWHRPYAFYRSYG